MLKVTSSFEKITKAVNLIDLEPIVYNLVNNENQLLSWSLEKADSLVLKYKNYLVLCKLYPQLAIVPTREVDEVWHNHILDTHKYETDCQNFFGYFLHHYPYFGSRGAEDAQNLTDAFAVTKMLYLNHFGTELVDPVSTECSVCEGSSCSVCTNVSDISLSNKSVAACNAICGDGYVSPSQCNAICGDGYLSNSLGSKARPRPKR